MNIVSSFNFFNYKEFISGELIKHSIVGSTDSFMKILNKRQKYSNIVSLENSNVNDNSNSFKQNSIIKINKQQSFHRKLERQNTFINNTFLKVINDLIFILFKVIWKN